MAEYCTPQLHRIVLVAGRFTCLQCEYERRQTAASAVEAKVKK